VTNSTGAADQYGFDDLDAAGLVGGLPRPVDWSELSAVERRAELHRLWPWVVELVRLWPVSRDVVPPCWFRHEALIRILSAARDAYLAAYHPTQHSSAPADWMQVWDSTEDRLRRWVSRSGCKSAEHHPDRIQRWVADDDEAARVLAGFEGYVVTDHARRAADELQGAIAEDDDLSA